jgi:hypothetical protein
LVEALVLPSFQVLCLAVVTVDLFLVLGLVLHDQVVEEEL